MSNSSLSVMYLIDAHCHLHEPWFKHDIDEVVSAAEAVSVQKIVNCASDPKAYDQVQGTAGHDNVWFTLGMQPTLADDHLSAAPIEAYLGDERLLAIGEVGLDYYWVKDKDLRKRQETLFLSSIELANNQGLPLVVHSRKAETACLDILEAQAQVPVLLHSFDGNLKEVNRAIDLGYVISVPTIVTRRRNRRKVTVRAGIENIMIETDAPFCQPREDIERNEPKYIPIAAEYMAQLLEISPEEFAQKTTHNAERFYKF